MTMKKILFVLILFGSFSVANAQFVNFGIKGGVNYNSNGDLSIQEFSISSDEETGYHFGVFSEIKLPLWLYLRPELVYTHTESSYSEDGDKVKLKKDIIEAPVLVGIRVLKIGRFFLGPSFQYAINTDLKSSSIDNIKTVSTEDFTVAGQIGIGLNLGKFGADLRWEVGINDTEAEFSIEDIDNLDVFVDTSQQQFILSFYYKFK